MSRLKEQIQRDIAKTFNNTEEFADKMDVEYNGAAYSGIPVVIDSEIAKERKKTSGDNSVGVYAIDVTAFISFEDLKILPRKETNIVIGGVTYRIVTSAFTAGEITLGLELLNE